MDFEVNKIMKPDNRITLSEVSRKAPQILQSGDSHLLEEGSAPTLNDLAGSLQFALGDGRIWMNDERMVLMETATLGDLRAKMIAEMGMERTRKRVMEVGWKQGVYYANLVKKRFTQENLTAALAAGPRVHTMQGFAKVTTRRFQFDAAKKEYLGEFYWHDSAEGTEHFRNFGVCDCPVCWMQVAVPSGYTSTILGYPVIFREIECVGQGAQRCLVIGKDADSWGEDIPEFETFGVKSTQNRKSKPWAPPTEFAPPSKSEVKQSDVVGRSAAVSRARRLIQQVAPYNEPVLLLGETGTGKEHFARHLHALSNNPDAPFIPVNCSAFTGASDPEQNRLFGEGGLIETAHSGTLFLNDVTALAPNLQARLALLMAAQDLPFRLVSATGEQPVDAVTDGRMRADLHYLLSILPIQVPPLRDRLDDLPELIEHFLELHCKRHQKQVQGLSSAVFDMLLRYDYPGNLRELSNMIERGVIYADASGLIDISNIFTGIEKAPRVVGRVQKDGDVYRPKTVSDVRGERTFEEMEAGVILQALDQADWNISAAARNLGLTRAKLDYRVKKFQLKEGD